MGHSARKAHRAAGRVQRQGSLIRIRDALAIVALVVLSLAGLSFIVTFLPWTVNWELWNVMIAFGTIGATIVAVLLAARAIRKERDSTARVVAAWISDHYEPRADGSSYQRSVHVHVANEGGEPVFDARVNVLIGRGQTPIGPLSVPLPISVVPPRRELVYDISVPLRAHEDSWNPRVVLYFTDSKGRRWLRESSGELRDFSRDKAQWSGVLDAVDPVQVGDLNSVLNPMTIAVMFLNCLRSGEFSRDLQEVILAPDAPGWADVDWERLRVDLERYQPATFVDYPAPRIARVKLSGDPTLEGRRVEGEGMELSDYRFLTLVLRPEFGWRIFSVGAGLQPTDIYFDGSLLEDIPPGSGRWE